MKLCVDIQSTPRGSGGSDVRTPTPTRRYPYPLPPWGLWTPVLPYLQMITYRLPVCICACPNLHDSPMLPPGSDTPTSSTIPKEALSECLVHICSEHHAGDYFTFLLCSSPFVLLEAQLAHICKHHMIWKSRGVCT